MFYVEMMVLGLAAVVWGWPMRAAADPNGAEKPLRVGVVGYEGHGSVFTNDLNAGLGDRIGLKVAYVWHKAPIDKETREKYGFAVVEKPEDMIGNVDGVIIAEELPHRYRELAEPFIRAGVHTFLNRPLAGSAKDAAALLKLARECRNPIFAASLLAVDPSVLAVREARKPFEPLKVVNVTGPTNHFWWYVPHAISALVSAIGPGVEEIHVHDFAWDQEGVTFRNPLVIFFRYAKDAPAGPVRGTIQVVPQTQPEDWYGFRMKLYGHKESPEYAFMKTPPGESVWMPIYQAMIPFFREGRVPFTEQELMEVPLILDMVLRSGLEKRAVTRGEYNEVLMLLKEEANR
jgi:hypothetical protein